MKYCLYMYDESDFRGRFANTWHTRFFLVALVVGYANWRKYDRIEVRHKKWIWIVKE